MTQHAALVAFVVLGMGLLVECRHFGSWRCSDRPNIPGSVVQIRGNYALYTCCTPNTYKAGGTVLNCRTKSWKTGVPLSCTIDGNWATWGPWDTCTTTCGPCTQTRTRTCTNPAPLNGGAACPGSPSGTQACNLTPCPVDGVWGQWTGWGNCNPPVCPEEVTLRTRTRQCNNPAPAFGGDDCVGPTSQDDTECSITTGTAECPLYTVVMCSSNNYEPSSCDVVAAGSILSIWVANQLSNSACTCDVSYNHLGSYIHVIEGCRANFHVCYVAA